MNLSERIQLLSRVRVSRGKTPAAHAGALRALKRILAQLEKKQGGYVHPATGKLRIEWLKNLVLLHEEELSKALKAEAARNHFPRSGWQFRRCGKSNCHCMAPAGELHGPYRYTRKRTERPRPATGSKIYSSVYGGKR
jgi:hypothetical protein